MGQLNGNGGSTKFLVRGAVSNDRVRKLVSVKGGRGGEGVVVAASWPTGESEKEGVQCDSPPLSRGG
jgi:hypothetical protein